MIGAPRGFAAIALRLVVFPIAIIATCAPARIAALTFTVNSTGDAPDQTIDGACDTGGTVGGSAECTLRAAIEESNANSGLDVIHFDIPATDAGCAGGVCVVQLTWTSLLPDITSPIVIDGSTQPGNAAVCTQPIPDRPAYGIVLQGDSVGAGNGVGGIGLRLEQGSDGSTIRGLNLRNFSDAIPLIRTNNSTVACNFIGTNETGTASGPGDTLNGVILGCHSTGNVIGAMPGGSGWLYNGNVLSGNGVSGIFIDSGVTLAQIFANRIGTDRTGLLAVANQFDGVTIEPDPNDASNHPNGIQIGGADPAAGNVLAANGASGTGSGVYVLGSSSITVQGNFIGVGADGAAPMGNIMGVEIAGSTGVLVGGATAGDGNVIAYNVDAGVGVYGNAAFGNTISRNSIFSNVALGIDLGNDNFVDGVTPNDPGDADTGPNGLQNFPEIEMVTQSGGNLEILYFVSSPAPLTIEFFVADADGQEGKTYLGSATYTGGTNIATVPAGPPGRIVATATDANGNTSEFSLAPVAQIPTLGNRSLALFVGLLAAVGVAVVRSRSPIRR